MIRTMRRHCGLLLLLPALPLLAAAQPPPDRAATPAVAAAPVQPPAPAIATPPALTYPLQHGFHAIRSFKAVSGLNGWVLQSADGDYSVFYSTADGQVLIAGDLLTSAGDNLTDRYVEQYVPAPDLSTIWARVENAATIVAGAHGNPKSVIYAIMDPNCIFCHLLWIALKPYEAAGLQVRWVPVGFLHRDSAAKAAALLKGGESALAQLQEHFDEKAESGGIVGIPMTPELKSALDSNLALMHDARVEGTPGIFYKDASGHAHRQSGMPGLEDLPAITGLPEQQESDPELAQFGKLAVHPPK
jgi:thiol:disulfide interchange protein DsbG